MIEVVGYLKSRYQYINSYFVWYSDASSGLITTEPDVNNDEYQELIGGAFLRKDYYPNISKNKILRDKSTGVLVLVISENKLRYLVTDINIASIYSVPKSSDYVVDNTLKNIKLI